MERSKLRIFDPNTGLPEEIAEDALAKSVQVGSIEELDKSFEEMLANNVDSTERARITNEYQELRRQFLGITPPLNEVEKVDRFNALPKLITKKNIKQAQNWLKLYKKGLINCDDDPSIVQRMQKIAFTRLR